MPDRVRIKRKPTARETMWAARALYASMICRGWTLEDPEKDFVALNDFVAECQEDIAKGDARPEWLAKVEELADAAERDLKRQPLALIRGEVVAMPSAGDPSPPAGRLIVHNREMHLEPFGDTLSVGNTLEVVRGNGPREGERMGFATVTGFDPSSGAPEIDWNFGESRGKDA